MEPHLVLKWGNHLCHEAKFACSVFLSYFLRLTTAFKVRPTPVKVAMTIGFNVIPPATAALILNLPAERLQNFFFENRGATFHSHNVSYGDKHINLSEF